MDSGGDLIGGFIAFTGADLRERRRADAVAYLRGVDRPGRASLVQHLQESRSAFPPVQPDELYLSKVGVRSEARGRGHGRVLVEHFLSMGLDRGLRHFVLDVSADNVSALRLYQFMGFWVTTRSDIPEGAMTYFTMRLDIGSKRS
jgi:ribosomal protein S18 acetylase RimI-like enzyme